MISNSQFLLLTFDYELFLGKRSGTVSRCMIEPTKHIQKLLKRYNCRAVFFIDTTFLMTLKSKIQFKACREDLDLIFTQLQSLYKDGHYLYHHIHPHWFDAIYLPELNQWDLSDKHRFSITGLPHEEVETLFQQSTKVLQEIIYPVDANYKPEGFRAGGLYFQPFGSMKNTFIKYGIKYDFSVLRGMVNIQDGFYFDYTKHPEKYIYRFDQDLTREKIDGPFYEFSIGTLKLKGTQKLINSIEYRLNKGNTNRKIFGDGLPSGNHLGFKTNKKAALTEKIRNKLVTQETYSLELVTSLKIKSYLQALKCEGYLQIISHPKLISEYTLEMFNKFLEISFAECNLNTDFKMMINN